MEHGWKVLFHILVKIWIFISTTHYHFLWFLVPILPEHLWDSVRKFIYFLPVYVQVGTSVFSKVQRSYLFWKVSDFSYTSFQSFQKVNDKNRQFLLTLFVLSLAFTLFNLYFTPVLYFISVSERNRGKGMPLPAQLLPLADLFLFWITWFLLVNLPNFCDFNDIITTLYNNIILWSLFFWITE